jgi:hypothetical protein
MTLTERIKANEAVQDYNRHVQEHRSGTIACHQCRRLSEKAADAQVAAAPTWLQRMTAKDLTGQVAQ